MIAILPTGKVRILALGAPRRDPFYPDVPTIQESTGVDAVVGNWRGIIAPKGTPADRIAVLAAAFEKVSKRPEYADFLQKNKLTNDFRGTEEFRRRYAADAEVILKVLDSIEK